MPCSARRPTVESKQVPFCWLLIGLLGAWSVFLLVMWSDARSDRDDAFADRDRMANELATADAYNSCKDELDARYLEAQLAFIVALYEGQGAEVARVDAQVAMGKLLDANRQCGG